MKYRDAQGRFKKMGFLDKVDPRDIVAVIVLIGAGILIYNGKNGFVSAIAAAIIGYYFSKRVYEEKNRE